MIHVSLNICVSLDVTLSFRNSSIFYSHQTDIFPYYFCKNSLSLCALYVLAPNYVACVSPNS